MTISNIALKQVCKQLTGGYVSVTAEDTATAVPMFALKAG